MNLLKFKDKKYVILGLFSLLLLVLIIKIPNVQADNGWITETDDGYYEIGNGIEVKIDVLNGDYKSINDIDNLFYNSQKVYIKMNWRAVQDVTVGTSLKLELPINTSSKQVSFESPLMKSAEIVSDDGAILTQVKKDGNLITSFFDAKEQKPIEKGESGIILIPHNIFVNSDASQVPPHTLQLILTSDQDGQKVIQKQVSKVANGTKAINFSLKDAKGNNEIREFNSLESNEVQLNFEYESGTYGINNGDALLIKLDNFSNGNKVGKLLPYAYETINIKNSKAEIVGTLSFADNTNFDGNTYMRLEFNDVFSTAISVKGNVKVLQELSFKNMISDDSVITFHANKDEHNLMVRGPQSDEKVIENRFDIYLKDSKIVRKNITVNEVDVINENIEEVTVTGNISIEEKISHDEYFIDPNSIRIAKILDKKENATDNITSYSFDSNTLKPATGDSMDRIADEKRAYGGQRGLTLNEFESLRGKKNLMEFKKDENDNVIGFVLDLGTFNEAKGKTGQYVAIDSDRNINQINKDGKAYAYLIYYNVIDKNAPKDTKKNDNQGSLKIQIVDKSSSPIGNIKLAVENKNGFHEEKITNKDGFVSFEGLEPGKYILKQIESENTQMESVNFEVTAKNQTNLDLTIDSNNKKRDDIAYSTKIYTNGVGQTTESFINVISTDLEKGRFKISFKDKTTSEPIGGGEFLVFDKSGYRVEGDLGSIRIQSNGVGTSEKLPTGEYYFVQSKAPAGYEVDKTPIDIKITSEGEMSAYEVKTEGKVTLEIHNFSADTKVPIANSEFKLYSYDDINNTIGSITTDASGIGKSDTIPFGRYYLKQITVDNRYEIIDMNIPITIESSGLNEYGVYRMDIKNNLTSAQSNQGNGTVSIDDDDTPLGSIDLGDGNTIQPPPATSEPIPMDDRVPVENKVNPTTSDRFRIDYIVVFATIVLALFIVREQFANKTRGFK